MSSTSDQNLPEPNATDATSAPRPPAPITRQAVERVTLILRREKEKGTREDAIIKAMARDLAEWDEHSRMLLRKIAAGGDVPDTFPPDILLESNRLGPNMLSVMVSVPPPNVQKNSLVQHIGKQWIVAACGDNQFTLKLVE